MNKKIKNKNLIYYALAAIVYVAVLLLVEPSNGLTVVGRNMLAAVCGTIVLWVTVDIGWPSFLAFCLFVIGGIPLADIVAISWGGTLIPALHLYYDRDYYTGRNGCHSRRGKLVHYKKNMSEQAICVYYDVFRILHFA